MGRPEYDSTDSRTEQSAEIVGSAVQG